MNTKLEPPQTSFIVKSYEQIEKLIENNKNQVLNSYIYTLETMIKKMLNSKPLNYFFGDAFELPFPNHFESYNYVRFISNDDLEKMSETLSKRFEPFLVVIRWSKKMHFSSYDYKLIGIINFNKERVNELAASNNYYFALNKEVCVVDKWIENIGNDIFETKQKEIFHSLNKTFSVKNFPKCLYNTEFINFNLTNYEISNIELYDIINNKELSMKISEYMNNKILNAFTLHLPKTYPNLRINPTVKCNFNSGYFTSNKLTIQIKLSYCYTVPTVGKNDKNDFVVEYC